MGMYASGILCYGVDCGEDLDLGENDDLGEYLLPGEDWKVRREAEKEYPVEIVRHGQEYYNAKIIALAGTVFKNFEAGEIQVLPGLEGVVAQNLDQEIQRAKDFCIEHGLPAFENPSWMIASSYG